MDRSIVYSGQLPRSFDFLFAQRAAMIGLAKLSKLVLGETTWLDGLECTPGTGLTVSIAKGQIYSGSHVDDTAYGIMPADTADTILKQGISLSATVLNTPAPGTVGQSINYLVQVGYKDVDGTPFVLPYYNSINPSQPLSGMNNDGLTQNTQRLGSCSIQIKAGAADTTGSQTTPAPDAGYIGAWVVTIAHGASSVVTGNIATYANAPFLPTSGVFQSLQANGPNSAVDTGSTANVFVASLSPAPASITDGFKVTIQTSRTNTSTATLALNGGTAIAIKTSITGTLAALSGGEIANSMDLVYKVAANAWILLNPVISAYVAAAIVASKQSVKAWATFNGSGTIQSSFNISSITKNATGDFTLTFATTMADALYAIGGSCGTANGVAGALGDGQVLSAGVSGITGLKTTTQCRVFDSDTGGGLRDSSSLSVIISGN